MRPRFKWCYWSVAKYLQYIDFSLWYLRIFVEINNIKSCKAFIHITPKIWWIWRMKKKCNLSWLRCNGKIFLRIMSDWYKNKIYCAAFACTRTFISARYLFHRIADTLFSDIQESIHRLFFLFFLTRTDLVELHFQQEL